MFFVDGVLVGQKTGNDTLLFLYDQGGNKYGFIYNGVYYYYDINLQGDVIGIYDSTGTKVVTYNYDPWGHFYTFNDTSGINIGTINPIRYRGYYYDNETGFYYLQSRYYDPNVCRFIAPDTTDILTKTPMALTDKNLYAYCDNNPVMRTDNGGQFWDFVLDVVSFVSSVVEVCKNPKDPMAWAGLAADTISLAVPGLTGGSTAIKAISKANNAISVVKKADKVADTAKAAKKGWKVGDDITNLTKAGKTPSWSTVRSRYWKNEAYFNSSNYSTSNIERMKKGKAPLVRYKNGKLYSMELHHKKPRQSGGSDKYDNLLPLSPWEHAEKDSFRHFKP